MLCACVCARASCLDGRSLRSPCVRCAWSMAPILGALVASVRSCVRWYVDRSARRSRRRSRPRGARSLIGERDGRRAAPELPHECMVACGGGFTCWATWNRHMYARAHLWAARVRLYTLPRPKFAKNFHLTRTQLVEYQACFTLRAAASPSDHGLNQASI